MERIKAWLTSEGAPFYGLLVLILLVAVMVLLVQFMHKPETVTHETQQQAETPAGVEDAADNARVPVTHEQAQQAAKEIRYIYTHEVKPTYTIKTTADNAQAQSEAARKAAGADFAIVTDKNNPEAKPDVAKLPKDTTVELNQYNVQAYKPVLHTVEVSPDIDVNGERVGIDEVGYTVQRKVTKDGKYLGVGASYNVDEHKVYAKVTYTW